jgi:sugar phosphate isomerase/epimerase
MEIGIFAKTFSRPSLIETLDAVRQSGLRTIQFNMALAGGPSMPEAIPDELALEIHQAMTERGLRMAAVSGTYNMAHPDPDVRADGRRRLGALIAAARSLGTGVVTLCTGSRDATDMWRGHPDNTTAEAWHDMIASVEAAVRQAESKRVTLAFEPERNNVVGSAAAARRLLDEIGSPPLKVVIDPANLVEGDELDHQRATLHEAFELLGRDLVLAHAKDVHDDGSIVAAGRGALDYDEYLALLTRVGDGGVPLILHGLSEPEVPASVAFLQGALARTGVC